MNIISSLVFGLDTTRNNIVASLSANCGDNSINGSKNVVLKSLIAEFMGSKSLYKTLNEYK
jgi:hypothetical protein